MTGYTVRCKAMWQMLWDVFEVLRGVALLWVTSFRGPLSQSSSHLILLLFLAFTAGSSDQNDFHCQLPSLVYEALLLMMDNLPSNKLSRSKYSEDIGNLLRANTARPPVDFCLLVSLWSLCSCLVCFLGVFFLALCNCPALLCGHFVCLCGCFVLQCTFLKDFSETAIFRVITLPLCLNAYLQRKDRNYALYFLDVPLFYKIYRLVFAFHTKWVIICQKCKEKCSTFRSFSSYHCLTKRKCCCLSW